MLLFSWNCKYVDETNTEQESTAKPSFCKYTLHKIILTAFYMLH